MELMVIEIHIDEKPIRIINCYGPQESDSVERKGLFWDRLESEVREADSSNIGIMIQMDGNLHAGCDMIRNDPNPINSNEKLFMNFLNNNSFLNLLNGTDKCDGSITRSRLQGKKLEQAVLD